MKRVCDHLKTVLVMCLVLLALSISFIPSYADEVSLSVSGNGSDSQNQVATASDSTNTTQQSNSAAIENNITTNNNTGENSASSNTDGATTIQTGSSNTATQIQNENINANVSTGSCGCSGNDASQIFANGSSSQNTVTSVSQNNTSVTQTNQATITTNIITNANTGGNTANNNNGNVKILTGNIISKFSVVNKNINQSIDPQERKQEMSFGIFGNGSNSINTINSSFGNQMFVIVNNEARIVNSDREYLNTGGNSASGNNGKILIATGDILKIASIENIGINESVVIPKEKSKVPVGGSSSPPANPATVPTPSTPSSSVSQGSSGVGGGGSNGGQVLGAVLPTTGGISLFFMTLGALLSFFCGMYLRFRADISPPFKLA